MKDKEWIVVLLLLIGGAWAGWAKWGKPFAEARSFTDQVNQFGGRLDPMTPDGSGGEPSRTGKVLVMVPGVRGRNGRPAELHSAWYRLPDEIRASSPEDVDTVVYVKSKLDAETYNSADGTRDVSVAHGFILLEVYDWKNRSFLGSHRIETGGPGFADELDTEDVEAMQDAVSPTAIAAWVEGLPLRAP